MQPLSTDWPTAIGSSIVPAPTPTAAGALDPQEDAPRLQVARAVAVYLAFRRDELSDEPDDILRLAVRAEYDGNPPALIANWLDEVGVEY